jgi:enoyl-[acyl-carrier-protein] reductase (NADH)
VQLGAAGATVYVTGRTTRSARSEMNRPETIEETAALVDEAGDRGIAVPVDHLVPDQVSALVTRIENEQGRLHVLVNNIWGATRMEWNKSVWESSLDYGPRTLRLAVDTHAITSHFALPLLIRTPGGLVVELTDGPDDYNATNYGVSFFYDLAKASVSRMAFALAQSYGGRTVRPLCHSRRVGCVRKRCSRHTASPNPPGATRRRGRFTSPSPRARQESDVSRWNGTSLSSGSWRKSTASAISTAANPHAWRYVREVQDAGKPADVTGYR